ncbi:MAG: hypothetical protein IPL99_25710 [Candidatus Competibacteraceae bacterium]|nr:hypothetical protein [Candidatus Competibacteraceae bacterium]
MGGAQGVVAAHSSRHVAWVADRSGTVLGALIRSNGAELPTADPGLTADYRRPQWIHCSGGNG